MAINKTGIAVGWCDVHRKLLYAKRKDARIVANRHRGEHKSPYVCEEYPEHWHIGTLHPLIVSGERTRDEIKTKTA